MTKPVNRNALPVNKPQETSWLHLSCKSSNDNSDASESSTAQQASCYTTRPATGSVEIASEPWCSKQNRFHDSEEPSVSSLASATIKPASDTQPKSERTGWGGFPACIRALVPRHCWCWRGKQRQSCEPQDVTCAGYWEDITVCHRLQISARLSLSMRLMIIMQRTEHCALKTAEPALTQLINTLMVIISFTIEKLTAPNHPFHIYTFTKVSYIRTPYEKAQFTPKWNLLSLQNTKEMFSRMFRLLFSTQQNKDKKAP